MNIRHSFVLSMIALGLAGCGSSGAGGLTKALGGGAAVLPPNGASQGVSPQRPVSIRFTPYAYKPGNLVALTVGYNGLPYAADSSADLVELSGCAFQTIGYAVPPGATPAGSYATIAAVPNGALFTSTGLFLDYQVGHWSPFAVRYASAAPAGQLIDLQGFNSFDVYLTGTPKNVLFASLPDTSSIDAVSNGGTVTRRSLSLGVVPGPVASDAAGNAWLLAALNGSSSELLEFSASLQILTTKALPLINPASSVWGPDGALWYVDTTANVVGRITPSGVLSRFAIPTPGSGAASITVGPDSNVWISEPNVSQIARVSEQGFFTEFPTSGFVPGPIAGPPVGASGAALTQFWFLSNGNQLVQVQL